MHSLCGLHLTIRLSKNIAAGHTNAENLGPLYSKRADVPPPQKNADFEKELIVNRILNGSIYPGKKLVPFS